MIKRLIVVFIFFLFVDSCISHTIDEVYDNVRYNYDIISKIGRVVNTKMTELMKLFYQHDLKLGKVEDRLQNLETSAKIQDETLKRLDGELKDQKEILKDQEDTLNSQSKTLQKQGEVLKSQGDSLEKLDERVDKVQSLLKKNLRNISNDVNVVKTVLTETPPGKTSSTPADSCSWLNEHYYNLNSGKYWFLKGGGSSYEYCTMDEAGVPPASCKELMKSNPNLKSGTYNITVGGKTFEVVCDMETDSGGWLLVGSAVVKTNEEAKEVDYKRIRDDDYSQLAKVRNGRFLLSTTGLNKLYDLQPFSEIRFNCYKPYHNKKFHIKTNTNDILKWLLRRRSPTPKPPSCGTFSRLPDDTSVTGADCKLWWEFTWNSNSIYKSPNYGYDVKRVDHGKWAPYFYFISLDFEKFQHVFCNDDIYHRPHFSDVGEWSYYVR